MSSSVQDSYSRKPLVRRARRAGEWRPEGPSIERASGCDAAKRWFRMRCMRDQSHGFGPRSPRSRTVPYPDSRAGVLSTHETHRGRSRDPRRNQSGLHRHGRGGVERDWDAARFRCHRVAVSSAEAGLPRIGAAAKFVKLTTPAIRVLICILCMISIGASFDAEAVSPVLGYLRHGHEPSMMERHPGAPPLPVDRVVLEAFAVSLGLLIAPVRHNPHGCPKLKTVTGKYLAPSSCVYLLSPTYKGISSEGYLVLYDEKSRAYAVESRYTYTGL